MRYLATMGFSKEGLLRQLEFDKYTQDEAKYAVENCGADWNEQAVKKASAYLTFGSFSRQGLVDQLVFDGFTKDEAEYGVSVAYK